jgi:hypothetical protein
MAGDYYDLQSPSLTRRWTDLSPSYGSNSMAGPQRLFDTPSQLPNIPQSAFPAQDYGTGNMFSDIGSMASAVLPFVGPGISLLKGLFGESPEEQAKRAQQENIARIVNSIKTTSFNQRSNEQGFANRNRALALQTGARERAAAHYAGSTGAFANPDVAAIDQNYGRNVSNINQAEQEAILKAQASFQTQPSYMFPQATDYLSSAFNSVNQYLSDRERMNLEKQRQDNLATILGRMS